MRYIMKGGVWKNSQDQILKAAIMKYGLNQWSRISSLLQRKSAKQCKQRWYEWLDPSIKKSEWSRAEDEKLLQLARVFPSQWRTIAPFVGRTPMQCFQRYEKLLDMAQGKSSQQTQELKKLRPGEIDPNPETKPAKLDPIDMDQDEKEMLAEVRVRLANTKGKKAKRKERQKIIEEARRLAQLQKIRQLDMAGVDNIPTQKELKRMRQKQDINYNKEIPFKREVPEFVYKLEESETHKNAQYASVISLQTLEGKRRDVEEQLQRKLDKKRLKKLKDRDFKSLANLKNSFQMPVAQPITLPEPQLNEKDLQDMKKYNITTPLNSLMMANSGNTPYGMTPENKIMLSARINFSLNHRDMAMTPIGEENDEQYFDRQKKIREEDEIDGVDSLSYLKNLEKEEKDPTNKMRSVDRILSERIKTPVGRDWQQDDGKIKSLFRNLRKPENEIQFEIPEEDLEESSNEEEERPLDYEERQKQELLEQERLMEEKNRLMSQVLKKNLPRPSQIPATLASSVKLEGDNASIIDEMVNNQIISMIFNDALEYPLSECQFPQNHNILPFASISFDRLESARRLINEEYEKLQKDPKKFNEKLKKTKNTLTLDFLNKKASISQSELTPEQKSLQEFQHLKLCIPSYKRHYSETQKLQKLVKKHLGGFDKMITKKIDEINDLQKQLQDLHTTRKVLQQFQLHEKNIMGVRVQQLQKFYKLVYNSI